MRMLTLLTAASASAVAAAACPGTMSEADTFSVNGTLYTACEDFSKPGGAIALVPVDAALKVEWFDKVCCCSCSCCCCCCCCCSCSC